MLKVLVGIEAQQGTAGALAGLLVQRKIDAQLRIGKRRHEYRHAVLARRFQDAASGAVPAQVFADALVELPTADGLSEVPLREDALHDLFDMVEVRLRLERVIDAVV